MVARVDAARPRRKLYFVGIRKRWELLSLIVRHQWKFYTGLLSLAISAVGLFLAEVRDVVGVFSGVAGIALGTALLIPDVRALLSDEVDLRMLGSSEEYRSTMPLVTESGEIVTQANRPTQRAIAWPAIDSTISTSLLDCELAQNPDLPPEVRRYKAIIVREKLRGRTAFDGILVGQRDDLTPEVLASSAVIRISRTHYFDLMCTNYMTNWAIVPGVGNPLLGWHLSQDPASGSLRKLTGSRLSNAIGASTVAVTADGFLVLVGQSNRSESSPAQWAPGGSGSVDDEDLSLLSSGRTKLRYLVAHAMERELQEEARVNAVEIETTILTGYFRWVNMGGKPEYLGVTLLRATAEELKERRRRYVERNWVRIVDVSVKLDLAGLRTGAPLACLPPSYRDTASFPLFMGLRALKMHIDRDQNLNNRLQQMVS